MKWHFSPISRKPKLINIPIFPVYKQSALKGMFCKMPLRFIALFSGIMIIVSWTEMQIGSLFYQGWHTSNELIPFYPLISYRTRYRISYNKNSMNSWFKFQSRRAFLRNNQIQNELISPFWSFCEWLTFPPFIHSRRFNAILLLLTIRFLRRFRIQAWKHKNVT